MKKLFLLPLLLALFSATVSAQAPVSTDPVLERQISESGVLHSPLPLDIAGSFEAREWEKTVLESTVLPITPDLAGWSHHGFGEMGHSTERTHSGAGSLRLSYLTDTGKRAQGPPDDPDYATYGNAGVSFDVGGADWSAFNRIEVWIYPDCKGARVVNMNMNVAGVSHLLNLRNNEWNRCFLDLGDIERSRVESLGFGVSLKGRDGTTGDKCVYYFDAIRLVRIANPEITSGWQPGTNSIVYSTSGYETTDQKRAIVNADTASKHGAGTFELLDATTGITVFSGAVRTETSSIDTFGVLDFSEFRREGTYRLKVGEATTPEFRIETGIWNNSLWRTLNFIFCQRCGHPVPDIHGECHTDLCAVHDGRTVSYGGGWHDAGDLSQQTLQTGDVTYALLEAHNKLKGTNPLLAARMLEEARWGLEFILRTRFGDGYRASSMGLLIWLDGVFGTFDDINSVRTQNCAFDNFLYAAWEAYAAMTVDSDPALQEHLRRIAREDFEFALARHDKVGFGDFPHMYEHSYNTSESQYMAAASWSASMLYRLTGELYYAEKATEFIRYTIDCQRIEPLKDTGRTKGFFYRDTSRSAIVHYNHQSREQVYMEALIALCETQPSHPDHAKWMNSIRLYADYLKGLMAYTAPYGMLPSGVYHTDEWRDTQSFERLHLFAPADAVERYGKQLKNGVQLDRDHYLKRFPVWFGIFNGNTAVHLSTGKAAALCGRFLKDDELLQIGKEQLYWTVGLNPFGQSLIYGEGRNYPQMDSFSSGEMTGEIPVGIRSLGDEDIPEWPQTNNACYKEVWTTSAGKWISLATEFMTAPAETEIAPYNVLVLTERGGQHGGFTDAGLKWLAQQGAEMGFEITEINDTRSIDDDYLSRFRLVIQLDFPPYTWTPEAEKAFTRYIDEGRGGWVGFHHATLLGEFDGYPMWQWFSDFMGGIRFQNYIAALADGTVRTEDATHPVMRGVPASFVIPDDEFYTFDRSPRPNVHVLATVDEDSYRPASDIRMGDHPVIWTNPSKKARNVYFLVGHSPRLYEIETFTNLFRNAIRWTAENNTNNTTTP